MANPGKYAGPVDSSGKVTAELLFRGGLNANPSYFQGEAIGPYLSQFCLVPTTLGRDPIDQKITTYAAAQDFMITMPEWFNIQNGKPPVSGVGYRSPLYALRPGLRRVHSSRRALSSIPYCLPCRQIHWTAAQSR